MRHEQHEDDHVEEQHVDGPPKSVVKPSVHDEPSKDSGFRLVQLKDSVALRISLRGSRSVLK